MKQIHRRRRNEKKTYEAQICISMWYLRDANNGIPIISADNIIHICQYAEN